MRDLGCGDVGCSFITWFACFIHILASSDDDKLPEVSVENLQVGPHVGTVKDPEVEQRDAELENAIARTTHCALLEGDNKEQEMCPANCGSSPTSPHPELLELEIQKLSSIVVNNDEFLFLWDLKKLFGLRLDECLDVIATKSKLNIDDSGDRLQDLLIPNGTVEDNVVIVQ
jgi:hypothetical protein